MKSSTHTLFRAGLGTLGLALSATVCSQEATGAVAPAAAQPSPGFSWVLGGTLENSASYSGGSDRSTGLRPVIGLAVGRYTLSTGGGGALLDRDLDARDASGLSTRLFQGGNLRLTGSLRIDGGRKNSEEPLLRGLPDVRRTLRVRLGLVYDVNSQFSLRSSWSQDVLGRQGGATLNNTARYEFTLVPGTELALVAGAHLANTTYLRSYFGVPGSAAGVTTALPRFEPSGGLHSTEIGLDLRHNLHHHWVLLGGVRYSQLRGDARRSPLAIKPDNYSVSIGLAYRR